MIETTACILLVLLMLPFTVFFGVKLGRVAWLRANDYYTRQKSKEKE